MRILLADDHTLVRQGIVPFIKGLQSDVQVIEASDLEEALMHARSGLTLDIILLDLKMPGMRGTHGIRAMLEAIPGVPVVILSGSVDPQDVVDCANCGASGYLPKTLNAATMLMALRLVLSGEPYFPSFAINGGSPAGTPFERHAGSPGLPKMFAGLDDRERSILGMVVDGRTNKEIARALDLQEVTIKVQTRNIYRKLGAANRSQAVRIAMENGWHVDV